jgi:hypothetical protein
MWCGGLQWIMQNGVVAFLKVVFRLILYLLGMLFLLALIAIFWLIVFDVFFGVARANQFDVVKGIAIVPLVCLGIYSIVVFAYWLWNR